MQTAVRKRAADFDFLGDTPTPEFCENSREREPRSPAGTAQGFDPPLGAHRSAAGGAGKMAAPSAACVGFQATSAIEAAGGRKSPFLPYKEALFSGRSSCQIRAVLRPNPCRFGRVAFSTAQSDECVTPRGTPHGKRKRRQPHENSDFRYRD